MSSIKETAAQFFDACETGKGWEACSQYCDPDASFIAQADTFAGIDTVEAYTEAMKGLIAGPIPDASYEVKAFAVDEDRGSVSAFAVFKGTHSGEGGPVPASGKQVETDYVYVMEFDGDRIRHMTKIWNDGYAMRQLGWG
jgi:predicted ester cyclase